MKAIKENIQPTLFSLFEIAVGVLLLINPIGFTSGIIIAAGAVLLVTGIISTVKYFNLEAKAAAESKLLLKGLICFLVGYFCIVKYTWIVATFPILTMLYGIGILIGGLAKIQWTVDLIRARKGKWFLGAFASLLSMILAVIILLNPFATTAVLWIFVGISLIVEAVFDMVIIIVSNLVSKEDKE